MANHEAMCGKKSTQSTDDKESLWVPDKSEASYFLPISVDQRFDLRKYEKYCPYNIYRKMRRKLELI
jgi:hypothetical protein